jgi:L-lactate dehydrogenase complex protein LldG
MSSVLEQNQAARANILARVRSALKVTAPAPERAEAAERYVANRAQGPRPVAPPDLVIQFTRRARDMASTLEPLRSRDEIPRAVAAYLDRLELPAVLAGQKSKAGVCWPEFSDLDWSDAGLSVEARPTLGHDRVGVTGCFCAIAETGTLVFTAGTDTPTATTLLPDTHIAVVSATRIVRGMEEAFALVRADHPGMPRAINHISGPSRTGDIEQTIVLGAHGPYRVHILLLP